MMGLLVPIIGWNIASDSFPEVDARNTSEETGTTDTHSVALPSGSGGKLLVFFGHVTAGADNVTTPSGWTEEFKVASGNARLCLYSRTADGSEGSTLTVTTTGNLRRTAHTSYRVSGGGTIYSATATGSSTTPDPPNLAPAPGSAKYLWLTAEANFQGGTISAYPTDYDTDGITAASGSGSGQIRTSSGDRQNEASSENPGTFTVSTNTAWVAATVAIGPA